MHSISGLLHCTSETQARTMQKFPLAVKSWGFWPQVHTVYQIVTFGVSFGKPRAFEGTRWGNFYDKSDYDCNGIHAMPYWLSKTAPYFESQISHGHR
jgi:hypothetical protein